MSNARPFKSAFKGVVPRVDLSHDSVTRVGETPYRMRSGKPIGLDWDALRKPAEPDEDDR